MPTPTQHQTAYPPRHPPGGHEIETPEKERRSAAQPERPARATILCAFCKRPAIGRSTAELYAFLCPRHFLAAAAADFRPSAFGRAPADALTSAEAALVAKAIRILTTTQER